MIFGPVAIYSAVALIRTALLFLVNLPQTIRILSRLVNDPTGRFNFLHPSVVAFFLLFWTVLNILLVHGFARPIFMFVEWSRSDDGRKMAIERLLPRAWFCPQAGADLWEIYQPSMELYERWRGGYVSELNMLGRFLWTMARDLHWAQKFLIVAPVVVVPLIYAIVRGYFYIKPSVRRFWLRMRYLHWRNQRERERYRAISNLG
ncbi:hypothetical protein FB45DRAFT_931708 [Roridomyces roridus]|uniref:Uncharacterized protein n=1 Tax=Roridomyces roridus TaxID=1738132 RepID=A0AAD7FE04_9AGAR|nr:hypothetical protein FB45DRAFT_931708 [Roridomyces roridus]